MDSLETNLLLFQILNSFIDGNAHSTKSVSCLRYFFENVRAYRAPENVAMDKFQTFVDRGSTSWHFISHDSSRKPTDKNY